MGTMLTFSQIVSRRQFLFSAAVLGSGLNRLHAAEPLPRLPTLNEEIARALDAAPLRMLFEGTTPEDLAAWQGDFSARLRALIGPHSPPQNWTSERVSTTQLPDHTREEWLLKSDGTPSLPLYVLRPSGENESFPIVLALHGHGPFGHDPVVGIEATDRHIESIRNSNYDYGRQLVREGYLVIAPCMTPFGRRISDEQRASRTDPCAVALIRMMFLGQTLLGANLRDVTWALNFASGRPDARRDRVGCVGLSYGGRMTMLAAALDSRISVAVISGALNLFQERVRGGGYGCGAQVIPGLLEYGDTPEIASLIAPRHCLWEMGSRDALIVKGWADKAIDRLQRAWKASGSPDHLQFHRFDGGHAWSGVTAKALLAARLKDPPA